MRQLTLHALLNLPSTAQRNDLVSDALEVYDLFCGAGGFSEGARAAGCRVVFACDADSDALDTHARNHPSTVHLQCTLPCTLPLPTDGRCFHVHGSPPCHKFSGINKRSRTPTDKVGARNLTNWFLDFALASKATSWSMEQVACVETIDAVKRVQQLHGNAVHFAVFDFSTLGVPQSRKRLIAGSPNIINNLCNAQLRSVVHQSVRRAIAKPRGTHVRASKSWKRCERVNGKYRYERASINDFCKPIDEVAPTVCGTSVLRWVNPTGSAGWSNRLTPREMATLQTFPPTYKLPSRHAIAYRQIGNAVPPLLAKVLMDAVVHICKTDTSCQRDCA